MKTNAPHPGRFIAAGLLAGALWAPPAAAAPAAAAPSGGWREWVDGLQVRATLAPPDDRQTAAPAKSGDFCEVRFYAWQLADDGLTRAKLLDSAAFGQPSRWVVIGEGREKPALEWGLVGLRPGEGRQVRSPARHWPGATGAVLLEVQLVERKPGVAIKVLAQSAAIKPVRAGPGSRVALQWEMAVMDAKGNPTAVEIGNHAAAFAVGDGTVIRGLDLGVRGMAAGEVREITVPPYLGYADRAVGGGVIPPGSTLRLRVEMREVAQK